MSELHTNVTQQMHERLSKTGVYSPEAVQQYAVLHGAFYDTMAKRMNLTQEQFLELQPLPKVSADVSLKKNEMLRWFAGSAVVDQKGEPLTVFHGSPSVFKDFDPLSTMDGGFYFTENRRLAESFSKDEDGELGSVMAVNLKIANPKFIDLKGEQQPQQNEMRALFDLAKAEGHDGAILLNVNEFNGRATQYVAFSPDQVRSVDDGEFDAAKKRALENFRKWFDGSRAVNPNGSPLLLYHGTGADTGDEFQPGTYFTPRPDVADIYAKAPTRQADGSGPNVSPVFVSIKNPYIHDDQAVGENLSHAVLGKRGTLEQVREKLLAKGYDGIVLKNYHDLGGLQEQYVIFDPTQVKSAIGNDGGFDPRDSSILRQSAVLSEVTAGFANWFQESQVADEDGEPLVVYHSGTFDEQSDPVPVIGKNGFHFGTKDAAYDRVAGKAVEDQANYELIEEVDGRFYLDPEAWYDSPANGFSTEADARTWLIQAINPNHDASFADEPTLTAAYLSIQKMKRVADQAHDWSDAIAQAKADGYDGIVYKNLYEDKGSDSYIAFYPDQIKSVENNGRYNPNDPNVLHQSVWHGSPHEFDAFRLDKVGTGEGAKSFGFGLYFTETEEVAIGYANMPHFKRATVENPQVIKGMGPGARGLLDRIEKLGSVDGAHAEAKELLASMRSFGSFPSVQVDLADEIDLVTEFGRKLQVTPTGIKSNLYKVEIADGYVANFLDWDRALNHQPAEVRKVLAKIAPDHYAQDSDDYDESERGQTIYHRLSSIFGGDKGASEALSSAGIKGIKYLDGNSRGEGSGTNNMVVFDEGIVSITHKDGERVVPSERNVFMQSASPETQSVVKILYRGTNDSGEKIKGGIAEGSLFATPYEDVARSYAGSSGVIERIGLLSGAKMLTEGTREFAKLTGRRPGKLLNTMRDGENLKKACDDSVDKARAAGYDCVEFTSFRDLGTVILNAEMVIRSYIPPEEVAAAKDAFSDWFGSSKVVNGQGKPMVVYHGTKGSITAFEAQRIGKGSTIFGDYEVERYGIFVTPYPKLANDFATQGQNTTGAHIMPLYAHIENPLDMTLGYTDEVFNRVDAWGNSKGLNGYRMARNLCDNWGDWALFDKDGGQDPEFFIGMLKDLGYDGVKIYEPKVGGEGNSGATFIAFDSTQIKSAIGNRGTYSPNDPSILHQRRGSRGFYSPKTVEIGLLKDADSSTFIHESAHFFLDSLSRLAALPQAPQDIKDDFDILLRWFSVDGSDQQERLCAWLAMDLNGQREGHERFARGFESYAAAGQAPSPELEGMFAQFSEWLSQVCHLMVDELPAEVQGAMGRLLAAAVDSETESSDQSALRDRLYG